MSEKTRPGSPRVAPAQVHQATPALGWYSDNVLFGEVWEDAALSKRDRSLVTVATLVTRGNTTQLTGHFNRSLNHGISATELAEILTHLAFYTGWPGSMSALPVLCQVMESRGLELAQITQSTSENTPLGKRTLKQVSGKPALSLDDIEQQVIRLDLWQRKELPIRDRCLITIASLVAQGRFEQLQDAVLHGLANGLQSTEIEASFVHQSFYTGYPSVQLARQAVSALLKAP